MNRVWGMNGQGGMDGREMWTGKGGGNGKMERLWRSHEFMVIVKEITNEIKMRRHYMI
jgi:hypothetical protein